MSMTFLINSTKQVEPFLEAQTFKVLLMWKYSSFNPHDSFLFESPMALIIPVFLIINSIYCVHLSVPENITVYLIIMKMFVVNSIQDLGSFWDIVKL